jgi:type IV pilus assembly protein PilA
MYNWLKKHRNQKGFTLIELMIVIAIIGILAAIAIPQFASYRAKSYNTASISDSRNLRTDLEAYYAEWDSYPN